MARRRRLFKAGSRATICSGRGRSFWVMIYWRAINQKRCYRHGLNQNSLVNLLRHAGQFDVWLHCLYFPSGHTLRDCLLVKGQRLLCDVVVQWGCSRTVNWNMHNTVTMSLMRLFLDTLTSTCCCYFEELVFRWRKRTLGIARQRATSVASCQFCQHLSQKSSYWLSSKLLHVIIGQFTW